MRLYLQLSQTRQTIPFNYQPLLTGAIHKWIGGQNEVHDAMSLYSFSWLQHIRVEGKNGIRLTADSYFFISAFNNELLKCIVAGVQKDPAFCNGSQVTDIHIRDVPQFTNQQLFHPASPVFIKRREEDNNEKHLTYEDPRSNGCLTETLAKKLKAAGLDATGVEVRFDSQYPNPKTKIIRYRDIGNRVNLCPVVISGTPEQLAFAWNVGVGNSTGIGFGALM